MRPHIDVGGKVKDVKIIKETKQGSKGAGLISATNILEGRRNVKERFHEHKARRSNTRKIESK